MNKTQNVKIRKELGEKLRNAREKSQLTQAEVAENAEITVTYYAMAERGEVNPSFDILHKLIKIFKVKPTEIIPY